jgi:hypothetical protein
MPIRRFAAAALAVATLALAACSGAATSSAVAPPSSPGAATAVPSGSAAAPSATASGPSSAPSSAPSAAPSSGGTTAASGLLTPADLEKVTGLTGIVVAPRDPAKGAGGDVNLATADGKLVVMANFFNGAMFDTMKNSPNYREPLSGLGDAAFVGPSTDIGSTPFIVGFRKGDHTAMLSTFFKGSMTATMLTMDQLEALAAIVASRW